MVNDTQQIPEGYKQTDVGVIPEDWEIINLGSVGGFSKGRGIKKDEANSGEIPCIRYGEIYTHHNDIVKFFNSKISSEVARTSRKLKKGEILFAGSGETKEEIGKCVAYLHDLEAYAGGDIVILTPTKGDSMFLGYLLNSSKVNAQKASRGQGDAIVHISSAALSSVVISIPQDPKEQEKIAVALSDIDSLISKLDQLIQKKKNIKQGVMQELLTGKRRLPGFSGEWVEKKLDQIADFYKGSGLSKSKIVNDGKYPCILYGELFTTYSEVINQVISHTNAIEGLTSKKGDVLLPGSTTTSGIDLATASSLEVENVLLGGDMIVLRKKTNEAFNSKFLAHYLTHISKYKIAEISQGITIIHLHGSRLKDISIFVPSDIKEQDSISRIIVEMSSEILLLESQRKKYQDLKQGMMQQLLTGKIRLI